MLGVNLSKTVSVLEKLASLAILLVLSVALWINFNQPSDTSVEIGKTVFKVEIADDPTERESGLSGRDALSANEGMLFIFDQPGLYNFWMKDMNFALDFIWIDENLKVVDIDSDVQPSSYPQVVTSSVAAKYVLEVASGESTANGIELGGRVILKNIE